MKGPATLTKLMEQFQKLPGVGRKTAERLAFHMLKTPADEVGRFADALRDLKEKVRLCSICHSITEPDPCDICTDPGRDKGMICVVEEPHDVYSIERIGEFNGVYHCLLGALAPLDGIGPEQLKVAELVDRIDKGGVKEIIVATNPNVEGEATAMYLAKALAAKEILVTRIARGIPMGGDLEYADEVTLSKALGGRQKI